ncbi:hypothetical protein DV962_13670, partial [Staphylococcus pseudintermedius]
MAVLGRDPTVSRQRSRCDGLVRDVGGDGLGRSNEAGELSEVIARATVAPVDANLGQGFVEHAAGIGYTAAEVQAIRLVAMCGGGSGQLVVEEGH